MEYYVYIFLDPRKPGKFFYPQVNCSFLYEPFYIGYGKDSRYKRHLTKTYLNAGYNMYKEAKLKHIIETGYNPLDYIVFIDHKLTENSARNREIKLIKQIGRKDINGPLTNMTDGGEGWSGAKSPFKGKSYEERYGSKKAQEMKNVRSKRFKGKNNPMHGKAGSFKGQHHSLSAKQKLSEQHSISTKQLDLHFNLIKIWPSAKIAAKTLGLKSSSSITNVLSENQRNMTAAGFYWEYINKSNIKYNKL